MTHAPGTGRTVALTFDDGPSRYTPELLDLLRREHVHATFFVVGANAASAPDVVARTAGEGHLVGDHTWHHAYPNAVRGGWTRSYLQREMLSTRRIIASATGGPVCWFRPPAGLLTPAVRRASHDLGFSIALWSVDTRDWQLQSSDHESGSLASRTIVARAVEGLTQQHPVILMHDGGGYRQASIDAVTQIIRTYRARGYRFVRLDGRS